ncbi:MAG: hypothetical protein JKX98_05340 [Alcanivoracaceae bacterium]|nr:hypothetical protein [Alcanivoracaceae bacterium]
MPNNITSFILAIFLLQIATISYYYVRLWLKSKSDLITSNKIITESEQKKLLTKLDARKKGNNRVVLLGLVLIAIISFVSLSLELVANILIFYSTLQLLYYIVDRNWYKQYIWGKLKSPDPAQRTVNLQSRKLWSFVSPLLFSIVLLLYCATIIVGAYMGAYDIWNEKMLKIYALSPNTIKSHA